VGIVGKLAGTLPLTVARDARSLGSMRSRDETTATRPGWPSARVTREVEHQRETIDTTAERNFFSNLIAVTSPAGSTGVNEMADRSVNPVPTPSGCESSASREAVAADGLRRKDCTSSRARSPRCRTDMRCHRKTAYPGALRKPSRFRRKPLHSPLCVLPPHAGRDAGR
jgi:hypothetical protein